MTLMTSLMTSLDCLPHQAWTRSFDSWGLPLMTLMTSLMTSLDCLPHQAWTRSFDSWEDKWREQGRRVLPTAASRFGGAC
jgi:P2-related tail formation protein